MERTHGRKGFTLIELLVVIAIIAILAAILFPIFARARERGKAANCISNLKQIATAIQMYVDEWNNCYIDQTSVGIPYQNGYSNAMGTEWIVEFSHRYRKADGTAGGMSIGLKGYLKSWGRVFKCASEPVQRPIVSWLPYTQGSSYYYKHALCFYANNNKRPLKQATVTYPARCTLLYEEAWHAGIQNPYLWGTNDGDVTKRCNAIFIDCHVGHIDIPIQWINGTYDGNWFFLPHTQTGLWDVSQGARDK